MRWLTALAGLVLVGGCAPAGGTTWYVDYAGGRDTADGRSPETAWKHAPGDLSATAMPASQAIRPGDRVLFKAGVPYRGSIRLAASGTADKPIIYSGLGFGSGMGVIDGSDPVTAVRPCRSAADCGGAPGWAGLARVEFTPPPTARVVLFGAEGLYFLSQLPMLPDPFFSDDRSAFRAVPQAQLGQLQQGVLEAPELAKAAASGGQLELAFWVRGNEVVRRPVLAVEGNRLRFDPAGVNFWDKRENRVALNGAFDGLSQAGRYMLLAPGVLVAKLRPGDGAQTLSIGNGRNAFNLMRQSHVTLTGLDFRNFAGSRESRREGIPVAAWHDGATGIEVSGNRFGPGLLEHGQGVVQVQGTVGLLLKANRIENVMMASGLRTAGVNRSMRIEGNVIRRIGRTGLTLFSVDGAEVRGNMLFDIRGIHGNGITAYLKNRDLLIEGNCVVMSSRPLTFHGNREPGVRNGITIRGNIFVTDPDGQGGVLSWGAGTTDVVIAGNVIAGPKTGLLLNQSDRQVRVTGNDTSSIATRGPVPADWTVEGNSEGLSLERALQGRFSEEGCEVPASRLGLKLVRAGL